MDVTQHVWQSFRLGTSLCHLFNMLLPNFSHETLPISIEFPNFDYAGPEGTGVYAWAREKDNLKKCKKGAAKFIMRMTELKKTSDWPEDDPLWSVMELFGDDTGGLKKVLHTVIHLLDRLPDSAWMQDDVTSPSTPFGVLAQQGDANGSQEGFAIPPVPLGHSRHYSESPSPGRPPSGNAPLREMPSISQLQRVSNPGARQPLSINTSFDSKNFPRGGLSAGGPMTGVGAIDLGPMDAGPAAMSVWEIIKTEKKYVSDLEVLQAYSQALLQHSVVAPDTVHMMFSNLGRLLDMQRRFLTCLETEYEPMVERGGVAWSEGNWGLPFATFEKEFEVYEPYCANYMNALELVEKEGSNLSRDCLPLTIAELNAYLIIPIQRICRYPILLDALIKGATDKDYAYMDHLIRGHEVTKRMAESVNETIRQNSNVSIVAELQVRVKDWKGHHISEFGNLLLEGRFMVTKGNLDRDYEVYLFEKMILCCKEIVPDKKDKRSGKSGSLLKKQNADKHISGPPKKNLLSLKGRIYVNNLTHLERVGGEGDYALAVYWRQQENPNEFESFILHVKNSEQYTQWEAAINKLMIADRHRREMRDRDRHSTGTGRRYISPASNFAATPAIDTYMGSANGGGYFERDTGSAGWDEEVGTPSTSASSTPYAARRTLSGSGPSNGTRPPDRYSNMSARSSHDDPNGLLMAQWKSSQQGGSAGMVPPMPYRNASDASVATEASFGNPSGLPRGSLGRSIQTKMGRVLSDDSYGSELASTPEMSEAGQEILQTIKPNSRYASGIGLSRLSNGNGMSNPQAPSLRMRSASTPNVYQVPRPENEAQQVTPTHSPIKSSAYPTRALAAPTYDSHNDPMNREASRTMDRRYPSKPSVATNNEHHDFKRSSARSSRSTEMSETSSHSPKTPFDGHLPDSAKIATGMYGDVYKQNVIVKVSSPNVSCSSTRVCTVVVASDHC